MHLLYYRHMKRITESQKLRSLLEATPIMSLATVSKDGDPHCTVVVYDYDDDYHFYFATSKKSSKAVHINTTGKASFAIVSKTLDLTLQGSGLAKQMKGPQMVEQLKRLLEKANNAIDGWSPISKFSADDLVVYKITPSHLVFLDIAAVEDVPEGLKFENLMTKK